MEIMVSHDVTTSNIHLIAPASPESCSFEGLRFFSAPTSPKTEPHTRRASSKDGGGDDFEFETSRRFDDVVLENPAKQQQHQQREKSQGREGPCMAFADELFCDGKVKPLKLPPRLQNEGADGSRVQTPVASPTASPRYAGVRNRLSGRRSMWDDGFDPFEVALERVRAEERDSGRRRSRSLSPLKGFRGAGGDGDSDEVVGMRSSVSTRWTWRGSVGEERAEAGGQSWRAKKKVEPVEQFDPAPDMNTHLGSLEEERQRQRKLSLAEPRGVDFARRVRLAKIDHHASSCKPTLNAFSGSEVVNTPDQGKQNGGSVSITGVSKRQRIKKFLLRSTSLRGEFRMKEKGGDSLLAESGRKPNILRRLSFRSTGSKQSGQCNESKEVSRVGQTTLMCYRPRMLLCLGYGVKSSMHV